MAVTAEEQNGVIILKGRAYNITQAKNDALEPFGKQVHDYGLVLRLLPDEEQTQCLNQQIGNARFIRNHYLNDRIGYYEETKKTLSVSEYKKRYLPALKEEFPFLQLSDKFALEAALEQVEDAYQHFFLKLAKFPRYANKRKPSGNHYTTKFTNNNIRFETDKEGLPCLKLPKVGIVQFVLPKGCTMASICPDGTSIRKATVKKSAGVYEVSLHLEVIIDRIIPMDTFHVSDILAMDMGLKHFGTIGDGKDFVPVANPRWIRVHARRLRRLQQALSRKQYDPKTHTGSRNWEKAKLRVAKEQRKTANQRKDFHHKLSRAIADSCSVFVCENLNIRGMMKNRHLSKEVASVGWGGFLTMVRYKMEAAGKKFLKVDRWFASSQICSACGYKNPAVEDLSVREWDCPKCGTHHDRDGNAAGNMIREGVRILREEGYTILA